MPFRSKIWSGAKTKINLIKERCCSTQHSNRIPLDLITALPTFLITRAIYLFDAYWLFLLMLCFHRFIT